MSELSHVFDLKFCAEALNSAGLLTNHINSSLIVGKPPKLDDRGAACLAMLDGAHYHALGLLTLLSNANTPPAFALLRVQFESFARGLFFCLSANERELEHFLANDSVKEEVLDQKSNRKVLKPLGMKGMVGRAGKALGDKKSTLSRYVEKAYDEMCSHTHTGKTQIQHYSNLPVGPKYSNDEVLMLIHESSLIEISSFKFMLMKDLVLHDSAEEVCDRADELFASVVETIKGTRSK